MSAPALRVIIGGQAESATAPSNVRRPTSDVRPSPYWWRWIVIQSLRHGSWFPPLWPVKKMLRLLRRRSIRRALRSLAMQGELGYDGSEHFSFIEAFVSAEAERRTDPAFLVACERALHIGLVTVLGLPVILDDEIDGRGQSAFIRHFAWTVSRSRAHPLPPRLKP